MYNFWVTNDPDGTALHILDTDLSLPPEEATVTYEFLFGDPGTVGVITGLFASFFARNRRLCTDCNRGIRSDVDTLNY